MNGRLLAEQIRDAELVRRFGHVRRIQSTYIEADGPGLPLGAFCTIETRDGPSGRPGSPLLAKVVGIDRDSVVLAPFETGGAVFAGGVVEACATADLAPVGGALLGRVVDALGRPLDDRGPLRGAKYRTLELPPTSPLERVSSTEILETGVRAIDSLLTLAHGQRVGVFAAAGVGKTSLLTQIAQQVRADCCVICLVGERGREVEALWSEGLSPEARARTAVIAATSDQTAAMRVRAGDYAVALADALRREGRHVLLLLDSVTRLAMAMREIGLAAGEPPTVRAYTPGVFAAIPKLVERCGALKSGGAISAVMTVLSETDDVDDPISEMMKSLLDGHLVLSRSLAEHGHFPAIDVPRSVSRLASGLVSPRQRALARDAVSSLSLYENSKTLIETGVYVPGGDAEIDRAIALRPTLTSFLRQAQDERTPHQTAFDRLETLLEEDDYDA